MEQFQVGDLVQIKGDKQDSYGSKILLKEAEYLGISYKFTGNVSAIRFKDPSLARNYHGEGEYLVWTKHLELCVPKAVKGDDDDDCI